MSFMTAEEYYNYLFQMQSSNPPAQVMLAAAKNPYKIDVNTRQVEAPEFLSVERDHKSETLYFIIDRYVDYMDLAETTCMVQYTCLSTGKSYIYHVPFYDIVSFNTDTEKKIVFPWCIDGAATEVSGTVQYAFSFYKVDHEAKKFLYNLNTLPAESKVLYGMDVQNHPEHPEFGEGYPGITPDDYTYLLGLYNDLKKEFNVYWEEK